MRNYFGYIRVSTARQGESGASLPEQKAVIDSYARKQGISIKRWYEDRETAAKVGRTQFVQMLRALRRGEVDGLIFHKIDRSTRNYDDWAAIQRLLDDGIDVHVAGDAIDLKSRGGRLSADIQAVMAVDYIRNLKEEVKKGQRGRLKQGLYPWGAPPGYVNNGGTLPKTIDPITGPLVRRAFEEYATGRYTLRTLRPALYAWGLRSKGGKPLSVEGINKLLRRKFYIGLVIVRGDSYVGRHEPLVPKPIFDRVQQVLDGRTGPRIYRARQYVLQRMLLCRRCNRHLYAELQKGHAYYRCHSDGCQGTSLRESVIVERLFVDIGKMRLSAEAREGIAAAIEVRKYEIGKRREETRQGLLLRLAQVKDRLARLTDAYLDGVISKEDVAERKALLHEDQLTIEHALASDDDPERVFDERVARFLELLNSLKDLAEIGNPVEQREVLRSAISNCLIEGKYVDVEWKKPIRALLACEPVLSCPHKPDDYRTVPPGHREQSDDLFDQVAEIVLNEPDDTGV